MPISARNQLPGTVTSIHTGEVMAEVEVAVGEHRIVSVITRRSVEDSGCRRRRGHGRDQVDEVMLSKNGAA